MSSGQEIGQVYDHGFGNVNHLATLIELTTAALQVQQMWTSLESVFTGGDIAKAMPMEEGCCDSPEPGRLSTNGSRFLQFFEVLLNQIHKHDELQILLGWFGTAVSGHPDMCMSSGVPQDWRFPH